MRGGGFFSRVACPGRACRVSAHRRAGLPSPGCSLNPRRTRRGEPPGRGGPSPGAAQILSQRPGQAELGVAGDDQPGPPVRGRLLYCRQAQGFQRLVIQLATVVFAHDPIIPDHNIKVDLLMKSLVMDE
jgi:hypothetical protein